MSLPPLTHRGPAVGFQCGQFLTALRACRLGGLSQIAELMSPMPNTWSAASRSLPLDLGFGGTPFPSGGGEQLLPLPQDAFSTLVLQAAGSQGADAIEPAWGHPLTGMALHLPENVGYLAVHFGV